jgi:hypothetical protein
LTTRPHNRPASEDEAPGSLKSRLGWFALLWIGGVAAVATVGYGIRLVLIG